MVKSENERDPVERLKREEEEEEKVEGMESMGVQESSG